MLVSSTYLYNALSNQKKAQRKKEKFTTWDSAEAGVSTGVATFFVILASFFVLLEIVLLFFALNIAFSCSNVPEERIIHTTLAIIFTGPYMLLNIFFGKCGKTIQNLIVK